MTARPDNVTDHTYHWALGALAAALALAAFEATPADAAAPAAGRVTVPARVTPGRLVTINVSGFAPGARVHVEWGVYFNPPANCCITKLVPPASKPGFTLAAGAKTLHVRMPRLYAACPAVGCHDHDRTRFKPGQRVFVFVSTDLDYKGPGPFYAKALTRIARR
jgi:hypothetical protein